MSNRAIHLILVILTCFCHRGYPQSQAETYTWPADPAVLENLKKWQGEKFGLLIHMGLYSKLGTVESWGLCPEDWVSRDGYSDYCKYVQDYRDTKSVFDPQGFNPGKWADAFKNSGAKYVIFSTKHHDGFCLFDSKYTDFKVTDKGCSYASKPDANIAAKVFDACRKNGLGVGAYFSKPDWSCPDFWWPYYPPKDRNPNYDIMKFPERWKKFVEFTQSQIGEITSEYGKLDILWLDGCWVLPKSKITKSIEEYCKYPYDLDINMKLIAAHARANQPGMLIVDRWVYGEYENYLTPEQKIPEKALEVPWESCLTMGNAWGWVPGDSYKPAKELVQLLVKIVAKGGNLLLGIGPDGNGEFDEQVYDRLTEMGAWLSINGNAIFDTHPVEPFQEGNIAYTARNARTIFAIYLPGNDELQLPREILIRTSMKGKLKATLPAFDRQLRIERMPGGCNIYLPGSLQTKLATEYAIVIRIDEVP